MNRLAIYLAAAVLLLSGCMESSKPGNFSPEETSLIMAGDSLTPMRVLRTTSLEDSLVLRSVSEDVTPDPEDEVLKTLVQRMHATVTDHRTLGIGIAAPQVGVLKNVIWVQRFDKPGYPFEVYLNPVIRQYTARKQSYNEGCLSIPNTRGRTENRAYAVLLEYQDMEGEKHIEMIEGMTAVIVQHEVDHLKGILFPDHLNNDQ